MTLRRTGQEVAELYPSYTKEVRELIKMREDGGATFNRCPRDGSQSVIGRFAKFCAVSTSENPEKGLWLLLAHSVRVQIEGSQRSS